MSQQTESQGRIVMGNPHINVTLSKCRKKVHEQNKKNVEEEFDFVKLYRRRENCVNL